MKEVVEMLFCQGYVKVGGDRGGRHMGAGIEKRRQCKCN
jgi:hypothetical protein